VKPSLRSLVRRVTPSPAIPPLDDAFVARVREVLEPVLAPSGFVFARAEPGADRTTRTTVVTFEVDAEPFVARYPRTAGHLRSEGSPLSLWAELDADRDAVRLELESWQLSALLAVVRAGPGAPPKRRHLADDAVSSLSPDATLERAAALLRRLFDAAAAR
jgi:hypothetical protein